MLSEHGKNSEYLEQLDIKLTDLICREDLLQNPQKGTKTTIKELQKYLRVKKDLKMYQDEVAHVQEELYEATARVQAQRDYYTKQIEQARTQLFKQTFENEQLRKLQDQLEAERKHILLS